MIEQQNANEYFFVKNNFKHMFLIYGHATLYTLKTTWWDYTQWIILNRAHVIIVANYDFSAIKVEKNSQDLFLSIGQLWFSKIYIQP